MRIESHDVDETIALGRLLGELAPPPPGVTCIGLDGPLGAGKTHLTRGIALGAGVLDPTLVSSPTYVLLNIYEGPKPVFHVDAYRVAADGLGDLGLDEILTGEGGIVVVEWAERIRELLPEDTLWVTLAHAGEGIASAERVLELAGGGARARELLRQVREHRAAQGPK
jgi:tRNA threonylcarbamoyladenosine biosynthesis protein TsaE